MLEEYFVKPSTIDRLRGSWIATEIETYVAWLAGQGYSTKSIWRRVPIGFAFGEFARERGARAVGDLPAHVEAFVADRVAAHHAHAGSARPMAKEVRGPVQQMLSVVLPGFEPTGRGHHPQPFAATVPGFFGYLDEERGLRPASIYQYRHHLDRFEAYLARIGVRSLGELSPPVLSAYIVERASAGLAKSTVRDSAGVLRVFLRYAHREGVLASDLSGAVGLRDSALSAVYGREILCALLTWGFAACSALAVLAGAHPPGAGRRRVPAAVRGTGPTAGCAWSRRTEGEERPGSGRLRVTTPM